MGKDHELGVVNQLVQQDENYEATKIKKSRK